MDQTIQNIVDYLISLASPVVNAGLKIAIRQVYVQIAGYIIAVIGIIIILNLSILLAEKSWKKLSNMAEYDANDSWWNGGLYFGIGMTILSAICILSSIYEIAARLINPMWYAIQLILLAIRSQTG